MPKHRHSRDEKPRTDLIIAIVTGAAAAFARAVIHQLVQLIDQLAQNM